MCVIFRPGLARRAAAHTTALKEQRRALSNSTRLRPGLLAMSSRSARCFSVSTAWISTHTSPRGHPNPRPDPPELVLPRFAAAASAFLAWAAFHWPGDAQLRAWYDAAVLVERQPQGAQRAHWAPLAEAFCDLFAEDYHRVAAGEDGVFLAPRDQYAGAGAQQRLEEERLQAALGGVLLRRYREGWKEAAWRQRKAKARFYEAAGIEDKWRHADTTEAQRGEAWEHVLALVALGRALRPPATRLQAEFPALWDIAERDARSAVPRDPAVTTQPPAWHSAVLAATQERYAVYLRKARDPARPDGHRLYPFPRELVAVGGGGGGGGGGSGRSSQ
jgi:hypothetical protein